MTVHVPRSRITKALTDLPDGLEFALAEKRLSSVRIAVVISGPLASTAAGQAAALTAIATAMKCFHRASLVIDTDVELVRPLPIGTTLARAARALGAKVSRQAASSTTHAIAIGQTPVDRPVFVSCWWDGWQAGLSPAWEIRPCGASGNPIAGVFAGALAIREVFATVRDDQRAGRRAITVSLWQPWVPSGLAEAGPESLTMPDHLWLVGLGHLGQAFLWAIAFLNVAGQLTLHDDQTVGDENVDTGLINTPRNIGKMKTRVAADWAEACGWKTRMIERRFNDDLRPTNHEPPILVSCLDSVEPRLALARSGFAYMVDAGVGHGPIDFEGIQVRVLPRGVDPGKYWGNPPKKKNIEEIMQLNAYKALSKDKDPCGSFPLAEASVAVPFVGAITAALTLVQMMRLASLKPTMDMIHMELAAPMRPSAGTEISRSRQATGGTQIHF